MQMHGICMKIVLFHRVIHAHSHTRAIIKHVVLCLSQKLLIPHVVQSPDVPIPISQSPHPIPNSLGRSPAFSVSRRQSPAVCFMQILPLCATMLLKNDNKPSIEQKKWLPGYRFSGKSDWLVSCKLKYGRNLKNLSGNVAVTKANGSGSQSFRRMR